MPHKSVKMSCATAQFPELPFCWPHVKHHEVIGLSNHYYSKTDPKLLHGKHPILKIPSYCVSITNMSDKTWSPGVYPAQQPRYQPVVELTYWPVLEFFIYWATIQITNKTTSSEDFE